MRRYTSDEKEFLKKIIPGNSHRDIAALFNGRFTSGITLDQVKSFIKNNDLNTGRTGRFVKGQVSWNKGKTWDEFMPADSQERSRSTTFKNGNLPANHREIGDERISKDGYIEVKVAMFRQRKANDCWVMKHRLIWEEANGPVPDGHKVVFKDGDKTNLDVDNLMLVSMAQHAVMAKRGLHGVGETGRMVADLVMAVNRAEKKVGGRRGHEN